MLDTYGKAFNQFINHQKSEIFFSSNTQQSMKSLIMSVLSVSTQIGSRRYLGLPSIIDKIRRVVFCFLKDRIWKRINQWSGKHLSKAGKEVLIKSCAKYIPFYCIECLPPTHFFARGNSKNDEFIFVGF